MLNAFHAKWLDIVFVWVSFMGDGLFSILTAAALFLAKFRRLSVYIIITYVISGIKT